MPSIKQLYQAPGIGSPANGFSMQTPTNNSTIHHEPAMPDQVIEGLAVRPGGAYIDCTLGDGGHAAAILEASAPDGRVLGIDADPEAIAPATERLRNFGARIVITNANFGTVASQAQASGFVPADGVLFDLGLSSRQLNAENRASASSAALRWTCVSLPKAHRPRIS